MEDNRKHHESDREPQKKELEKIDILQVFRYLGVMGVGLRRYLLPAILVIALAAGGNIYRVRRSYSPVYTAYTTFVVTTDDIYTFSGTTYYNINTSSQMEKTFPYILKSAALGDIVANDLGSPSLNASINVSAMEGTNLISLIVRAGDPDWAYQVLQSVIRNYPKVSEFVVGPTVLTPMDESGVPTRPDNPLDLTTAGMEGASLGGMVVMLFLFFYAITRRTVDSEDKLKQYVSVPMFGSLPSVYLKKRRTEIPLVLMTRDSVRAVIGEPMRMIRTAFLRETEALGGKDGQGKVIVVSSSLAGEGKTTVAVNLALALERKDYRVAVIDGDLRHPSVAGAMGIQPAKGFDEYLEGRCYAEEVAIDTGAMKLVTVYPGNKAVNNPTHLICSPPMHRLMKQLRETKDFIIIDTPPCTVMSDASLYAEFADGCLLVVRRSFATIDRVITGFERMEDSGMKLMGYILNGGDPSQNYGYGKYGYGYGRYGYGYGYGKYGYGYGKYGYGYGTEADTDSGK